MGYPASYRIKARQGSTYKRTFTWSVAGEPVDLTNWTAQMQVRPSANSSTLTLDCSEYLTLGDEAGTIELNIPAEAMQTVSSGRYLYDLELSSGTEVTPLLAGSFVVDAEVTKA